MINIEVYLDNRLLAYGQDYLLEQPIRVVDSDDEKVERFEGEVTFINDTYNLILDRLVDNPQYARTGLVQGIPIRFVDLCDGTTFFRGEIRADTLDFCDNECFVTATPVNTSDRKRFLDFFESTYISEPESIRNTINHPKTVYARVSGGNATGYLITFLLSIVSAVIILVDRIIDVVRTILEVVSLGLLRGRIDFLNLDSVIVAIQDEGTGLAYFHPTPYLRTYIAETIALANQKAGTNITFRSSIFEPDSPYYNTVYLFSDYQKGRDIDFNSLSDVGLITNEPLKTGGDLLDDLAIVFNAKWRLIGDELVFERKDLFETNGADIRQFKTCYTLRDEPLPQAIEIKFTDDGSNTEPNTNGHYDYFELWNKDPFSPRQKGIKQVIIPFGRTRQLYDRDVDYTPVSDRNIEFEQYAVAQLIYQAFFGNTDPKIQRLRRDKPPLLVMDNGRLSNPVLMIIDPNQNSFWGNYIVNNNFDLYGKNLYDRFHFIDNPRGEYMRNRKPLNFSTEELPLSNYQIYDKVQISRGIGIVTEIEREYFPDRKVTLRGEM